MLSWLVHCQTSTAEPESPLKQFRQGTPISEITCSANYQLLLKKSSMTPVCVMPSTASELIERGWAVRTSPTESPAAKNDVNVDMTRTADSTFAIFYISGSNHTNLELFEKYLRPGDYLFITTDLDKDSDFSQVIQDKEEAKNKSMPGVKVFSFAWYSKIDAIRLHAAYLPPEIDGVIYDFENGTQYSPEYTTDYGKVSALFDSAADIAHRNKLLIMAAPVFGDIVNNTEIEHQWDWTEMSRHADFMIIQFQQFFKLSNADALRDRMGSIMTEIDKTSGTPTFVELSLTAAGGSADDDLQAMHDLRQANVNKFLLFFEPWKTADLEHIFEERTATLD